MLSAVKRILKLHGYDVEGFGNVQDFVARANTREARCLVLDVNLKDGSAFELHGKLMRSGISPPVIFMTGSDNVPTRSAAVKAGCLTYLVKPFSSASLLAAIKGIAPSA
jgi:FixJ family two-component response regulator